MNGILYVAYEQEIYSLLTLRFHKFEKTQSVKLGSIIYKLYCATAEIALFIEWHIVCCLRTRDLLFAYITVS
ncbi:hypothetical protein MSIBF_A2290004 [groundwater metagenome]|uniref:Uncharacterized protein n=1 Tax=groundwater metagenome TaxID=717931 RepID=A0A098EA77_9ZZZZ